MKKLLFGALAVTMMSSCANHSPRVIDMPLVESANTQVIQVTSVDVNDSVTVLNMHCEFNPGYWVRIPSGVQIEADGVRYSLLRGEGFVPDSLFWMPESGEADFSLVFEPVPLSTESIDFMEDGDPKGWHIWGIDLTGRTEPRWLDQVPEKLRRTPDLNAMMPEALLDTGTTRLNVVIPGFRKGMNRELILFVNEPFSGDQVQHQLMLDSLGRGATELKLGGTSKVFVVDNQCLRSLATLILAPGEDVTAYIAPFTPYSSTMQCNRVYYDGRYAPIEFATKELNNSRLGYERLYSDIAYNETAEQFSDRLVRIYNELADSIDQSALPMMSRDVLLTELQVAVMGMASNPLRSLRSAYYEAHGYSAEPTPSDFKFQRLDSAQLAKIASLFDTGALKLMLSNGGDYNSNGVEWEKYSSGNEPRYPELFSLTRKNMIKAKNGQLTEEDVNAMESMDAHPFAVAVNAERLKYEESGFNERMARLIQPTPEVAANKVFDAIVAPHKGKVVIVDLWNTWCGPCRSALAENEPLKSGEFAGEDIVWIYIANETSPVSKYVDLAEGIDGLHYRLNPEQWRAICDRFEVDGIPFYILVDRNGNAESRPDIRQHDHYVKAIREKL